MSGHGLPRKLLQQRGLAATRFADDKDGVSKLEI
jgi:hypothetical protein